MKTIPYFKSLFLLIAVLFGQSCSEQNDFHLLGQTPKSLTDYQGKWLIVNFWAEWCAPCRKETPELNRLYHERMALNLEILGVSYDPLPNEDISQIVSEWKIEYPIMATNPVPILPFSLPNSLPGNYIINPNGEVVAKLKGEQTFESVTKLLITLKKQYSKSE